MLVHAALSHRLQTRRGLPSQITVPGRLSLPGKTAFIVFLHVIGWGGIILSAPSSVPGVPGGGLTLAGLGLTAYLLGLRHAFDVDHIAAIDGVTRKLVAQGRPSASVGFWFSLGHCSLVFVLSGLLMLGVHSLSAGPGGELAALQVFGPVGALVAGLFLYAIGFANLKVLLAAFRKRGTTRAAAGQDGAAVSAIKTPLGPLLARTSWLVERPRGMFLVGMLFGLGLDTTLEVAFLVIAAGGLLVADPLAPVMLPVLFAAGMILLDSLNGAFMSAAYISASWRPAGRNPYNTAVTAIAVGAAFAVGSLQLASVIASASGPAQVLEAGAGVIRDGGGYVLASAFLAIWWLWYLRHDAGNHRGSPARCGEGAAGAVPHPRDAS
jgi:nickel/cobalt transporter (NiCoT) family protein